MTEQQVRTIVQQELQKFKSQERFTTFKVPNHVHNGVDSPPIEGFINLSSSASMISQSVLALDNASVINGITTVYPVPVIQGDDFVGGSAPTGTVFGLVINGGSVFLCLSINNNGALYGAVLENLNE